MLDPGSEELCKKTNEGWYWNFDRQNPTPKSAISESVRFAFYLSRNDELQSADQNEGILLSKSFR